MESKLYDAGYTLPPSNGYTSRKRRLAIWPFLSIASVWLLFKAYPLLSPWREHDWPIPPNIQIDHCAELRHNPSNNNAEDPAPFSIPTTFALPLPSKALFFISRGGLSNGVINIIQSHKGAGSENAVVDVNVNYWEEPLLDSLRVCQVIRDDGGVGVGIFSERERRPRNHQVEFEVTITLPSVPNDAILYIDSLETDMPLFEHWIEELGDTVYFNSIILGTEYRGVDVASLNAANIEIKNSHSPIQGVINASSSLSLVTSNALINVFLGLSSSSDEATQLEMKTSNAEIAASISLTTHSGSSGGNYSILAQTSFAKLTLTFPSSPLTSTLSLNARTSLAAVDVSLHPTYEGTFTLDTSFTPFGAKVLVDEGVKDPAGEGRKRNVEVRKGNGGGHVEGSVGWGDEEDGKGGRGNVRLETVLGSANLRL